MNLSLLIATSDEHFRESIHDSLQNVPNAKIVAAYPEVSSNLYIRVLQDLERYPEAALIIDLAGDLESSLKVLDKVKQAAPDVYVIASNYHADGETVLASLRAGCNDYLVQPVKRADFRNVLARLERTPRRAATGQSHLGKIYTFLGAKGGVGTTTLAVNFAAALAGRDQHSVLVDLDFVANDCAMQLGCAPQHNLEEVGESLSKMDQALFEAFVTRDPLGFYLVGPPDLPEQRIRFNEPMFRDLAGFLVEKYPSVVIDAGRQLGDEVVLSALGSATLTFLVMTQHFAAIRAAQRMIGALMRLGFHQDHLRIVVNQSQKRTDANLATIDQIQQTLNQPVFTTIPASVEALAAVNRGRPFAAAAAPAGELDRAFRIFVDKVAGPRSAAKSA